LRTNPRSRLTRMAVIMMTVAPATRLPTDGCGDCDSVGGSAAGAVAIGHYFTAICGPAGTVSPYYGQATQATYALVYTIHTMRHTIELQPDEESRLEEIAARAGTSVDLVIARSVAALLSDTPCRDEVLIRSTLRVMGGDACIRNTRIPVWLLIEYKRSGMADGELLQCYPGLNAADLIAAWDYSAVHFDEVERQLREHAQAE